MRIGIDISTVLNHGQDIGAGRYIINLLKGLFEIEYLDQLFKAIEEIKLANFLINY